MTSEANLHSTAARSADLAADYFALARRQFAAAVARHGAAEKFFQIGGRNLRLRLVGGDSAGAILPALAHLATPAVESPDLTVNVVDLAMTKTAVAFPGGEFGAGEPPGASRVYADDQHFVFVQKEMAAVRLLNAGANEAFYWLRDAANLPPLENTFPLRQLLVQFFQPYGQHVIHSAAVGDEQGAVLIVGKGGSGKSTATLACATQGLFYLGDDYTLVAVEPEPRVWSLYGSAKVNADTLSWFPELKACLHHAGGTAEKSSLFLQRASGVQLTNTRPIRAVLWPRITQRSETRLVPAPPATLLLALAPSSILQNPGAGGAAILQMLSRLVQAVPTYILEVGNQPAGIAVAIKKFLAT